MYVVLKANCEEDKGIVLSLKFACIIYLNIIFFVYSVIIYILSEMEK